ncbi:hypothetical protein PHET_02116 [Paragonimus heterotremus]|uniref:Uncharacterized protein n=1 Tax=Paragonimus heterotremus TaxID=100268 RepID=A0A8J4T2J2_9TREM|nr:hypothetical protein PHET_02116 [Paragonimus heterotremus]
MKQSQPENDGPEKTQKRASYFTHEQRLNPKELEGLVFREITSDTTSSVSILGKRITRQYASEFVLPDDTRVAISRHESANPSDEMESVTLCLSIGLRLNAQQLTQALATADELGCTDSGAYTNTSTTSSEEIFSDVSLEMDKETGSKNRGTYGDLLNTSTEDLHAAALDRSIPRSSSKYTHCPHGLRISDYMNDDPWAAAILLVDSTANDDLLRQLETGCRLDPEAYRMERLQRRRNWETIIDLHNEPTIRSIGLSRAQSETDSINTACTDVGEDE